eukprot:1158115-Pelagomonas_calceolata.AAC.5
MGGQAPEKCIGPVPHSPQPHRFAQPQSQTPTTRSPRPHFCSPSGHDEVPQEIGSKYIMKAAQLMLVKQAWLTKNGTHGTDSFHSCPRFMPQTCQQASPTPSLTHYRQKKASPADKGTCKDHQAPAPMPTSHQYPTRSRQEAVRVGTGKAKEQAWGLMIRLAVLLVPWVAPSQVLHLDSQSTTMGARTRSGGGLQKSDVAWLAGSRGGKQPPCWFLSKDFRGLVVSSGMRLQPAEFQSANQGVTPISLILKLKLKYQRVSPI